MRKRKQINFSKNWERAYRWKLDETGDESLARMFADSSSASNPKHSGILDLESLPGNVLKLPAGAILLWEDIYNKKVKEHGAQKSKNLAWAFIKKRYYKSNHGDWRMKKNTFGSGPGSFSGEFQCSLDIRKDAEGNVTDVFIEGKASDTGIDLEDDRMSEHFVRKMQETAVGLTIFVDHDHRVEKAIGVITEAHGSLAKAADGDAEFFIKGKLQKPFDRESGTGSPEVAYILEKADAGIQLAFSIGGRILDSVKKHSEEIGREIRTIVDGVLAEVSVVALPANPRAAASISKSLSKALDELEEEGAMDTDGVLEADIDKILDEAVMSSKLQDLLYEYTWAYMGLIRKITFDSEMNGATKKKKLNQASSEFVDRIEKITDGLTEAIAAEVDFLEEVDQAA